MTYQRSRDKLLTISGFDLLASLYDLDITITIVNGGISFTGKRLKEAA